VEFIDKMNQILVILANKTLSVTRVCGAQLCDFAPGTAHQGCSSDKGTFKYHMTLQGRAGLLKPSYGGGGFDKIII